MGSVRGALLHHWLSLNIMKRTAISPKAIDIVHFLVNLSTHNYFQSISDVERYISGAE